MVNVKKIWILPLLGSILSLIALMTPTAYYGFSSVTFDYNEYQWMWGLLYADIFDYNFFDFDYIFEFTIYSPETLIPGLITTILLIFITIKGIISANQFRKESVYFSDIRRPWIIQGILYFSTAIFYIVGMEFGFRGYRFRTIGVPVSYWENRVPLLGIIAPFISGVLVIIGVIWGIKTQKREEVIVPLEQLRIKPKLIPQSEASPMSKSGHEAEVSTFHFCPECGHKIRIEGSKYCINCGFAFIS